VLGLGPASRVKKGVSGGVKKRVGQKSEQCSLGGENAFYVSVTIGRSRGGEVVKSSIPEARHWESVSKG